MKLVHTVLLASALILVSIFPTSMARADGTTEQRDDDAKTVSQHKTRVASTTVSQQVIQQIAAQVASAKLTPAEKARYEEQTRWLHTVAKRLHAHVEKMQELSLRLEKSGKSRELVQQMVQAHAALLQSVDDVITESREFSTLSNASKARHEAAMSSIRNIK